MIFLVPELSRRLVDVLSSKMHLMFCIGFIKLEWQGKKRVEQQLTFSILTSPLCAADSSLANTTRTAWHRNLVTSWRPCRCLEWRRRAARSLRMFRARSIWPKTVSCNDNLRVAMTTAVSNDDCSVSLTPRHLPLSKRDMQEKSRTIGNQVKLMPQSTGSVVDSCRN